MRVSDAERQHVAELLQKAVGRGLITLDEFTERTDRALAARTRGELNGVLVDLADLRPAAVVPTEQPLLLQTGSGSVKQRGYWVVPRTITIIVPRGWGVVMAEATSRMGNVVNKATDPPNPDQPVLRVHGRARMGNVKIRYPRGRH